MKAVIVLAMPGAPPPDFPERELAEFHDLHARLAHVFGAEQTSAHRRYRELDARIRTWPRTPRADPLFADSQELAIQLRRASGRKVILGFNEYGAPGLDEALDQAVGQAAEKIIVVTPAMIRGGGAAEKDIPEAVERARERHPKAKFFYVWPFPVAEIAGFLTSQAGRAIG